MNLIYKLGLGVLLHQLPLWAGVVLDCIPANQAVVRDDIQKHPADALTLAQDYLKSCPQSRPEDLGLTQAELDRQRLELATQAQLSLTKAKAACRPKDLSHDPRLPPRKTQGKHTWCLSYAMATATSFVLKTPVSAVGFAMAPAWQGGLREDSVIPETPNEIQMSQVFATAQNWGFCRESSLSSDTKDAGQLKSNYNLISYGPQAPTCSLHSLPMQQHRAIEESFKLNEREVLNSMYRIEHPDTRLMQMAADACEKQKITAHPALQFKFFGKSSRAYDRMNAALDADNIVGVTYDAKPVLKSEDDFGHASNIIGRRWTDHGCEYLVRDPYGPETPSQRPNVDGDVWVPRADLESGRTAIWSIEAT